MDRRWNVTEPRRVVQDHDMVTTLCLSPSGIRCFAVSGTSHLRCFSVGECLCDSPARHILKLGKVRVGQTVVCLWRGRVQTQISARECQAYARGEDDP